MDKIAKRRRDAGLPYRNWVHANFPDHAFWVVDHVLFGLRVPFDSPRAGAQWFDGGLARMTVQFECEGVLRVAATDMDGRLDASTFSGCVKRM